MEIRLLPSFSAGPDAASSHGRLLKCQCGVACRQIDPAGTQVLRYAPYPAGNKASGLSPHYPLLRSFECLLQ